jgi:chemotaxis protein CheD
MDQTTPIHFFDRELQVDTVRILPGQYYAGAGHGSISTVLGSCVATCLWDPVLRIGGMNHFMLPGGQGTPSLWGVSTRFGVHAMEVLINEMIRRGVERRRLVAKVFGGANVLKGFEMLDVGARNSEFVLTFLREEGIALKAQDLLGSSPRKLHFFPETGQVKLKRLHLVADDDIQRQERAYLDRLGDNAGGGDVELFTGKP